MRLESKGWAWAMDHVVCLFAPHPFQVIASSPGELAESICALASEQNGSGWDEEDAARNWDAVAELWIARWPGDIRVVPV